ncbi:hypothetical protein [Oxalicibacterium faecigallinarum]|uniref:Uncharacterized protein n=1 Tax=Oxalicibacterium faecigallinarum TaxID=573741 RepID=A0A8J3ATU8_9BURK|nr:hypothetical protein [Oxalicibacterium faecigallinarum]GGI16466.1 hypothetical protein GCM10008066_04100 [Oxalicibacterium faecigallinarum]
MAEPNLTGAAIAGTAITFSGTLIGMPFDTLLAGFAGGLVALSYLPGSLTVARVVGSLLSSTLLAGFFAQLVAQCAFTYLPWTRELGETMRVASAGGLGICSQVLIPLGLNWITSRSNRTGGQS